MEAFAEFQEQITQTKELTLTVHSGDTGAEVFLLNNKYNRIGATVGSLVEFKLEPGVYTVKVRAGSYTQEKSIVLLQDQELIFDAIKFSSPAPIEDTAKTHEYHLENAENNSRKIHLQIAEGSQLYVFTRDWTPGSDDGNTLKRNPAIGLTLMDMQEKLLVDFEAASDKYLYKDPWAACNVALLPGAYILCLKTASGDILKQPVVTSPGWQTQIFLLQRDYGVKEKDLRSDLSNAAIFIFRIGVGFNPLNRSNNYEFSDLRLTELARQALVNDRTRLAGNLLDQAFNRKFENPMLGIYAAHLLLLNEKYDKSFLEIVINNLRGLLQVSHPDVEALAIKAKIKTEYIFVNPPMLSNSWKYILDASAEFPEIVPADSPSADINRNLSTDSIWLIQCHMENQNKDVVSSLYDEFKQFLSREKEPDDNSDPQKKKSGVLFTAVKKLAFSQLFKKPARLFLKRLTGKIHFSMTEAQILRLVRTLGVPRSRLESTFNIKIKKEISETK
jgi:hypothetical protein